MKKMILSLMSATLVCAAFAQTCVSVQQISSDYTTHQITIALTRNGCTGDATSHRNTAWVFVDYRTVTGTGKGAWSRATVGISSAGTVVNSGNSKGVWIYGANGTQTVTLTLSGMPAKYDCCVFATDYPPNAASSSNGIYTLRGTPPFIVNGSTTVTNTAYNGAINTLTDATGCPCVGRDAPTYPGICCPGLTKVGGGIFGSSAYLYETTAYCRNLADDAASTCTNCGLEIKAVDATTTYSSEAQLAANPPCPDGWRTPSRAEFLCLCEQKSNIGGFPATYAAREWYLTSSRRSFPADGSGYVNNLMCETIPGGGHGQGVGQDANVCGIWSQSINFLLDPTNIPKKPTKVRCVR